MHTAGCGRQTSWSRHPATDPTVAEPWLAWYRLSKCMGLSKCNATNVFVYGRAAQRRQPPFPQPPRRLRGVLSPAHSSHLTAGPSRCFPRLGQLPPLVRVVGLSKIRTEAREAFFCSTPEQTVSTNATSRLTFPGCASCRPTGCEASPMSGGQRVGDDIAPGPMPWCHDNLSNRPEIRTSCKKKGSRRLREARQGGADQGGTPAHRTHRSFGRQDRKKERWSRASPPSVSPSTTNLSRGGKHWPAAPPSRPSSGITTLANHGNQVEGVPTSTGNFDGLRSMAVHLGPSRHCCLPVQATWSVTAPSVARRGHLPQRTLEQGPPPIHPWSGMTTVTSIHFVNLGDALSTYSPGTFGNTACPGIHSFHASSTSASTVLLFWAPGWLQTASPFCVSSRTGWEAHGRGRSRR